ncbi:unnamed protein product [Closterium sp. NIES-64]|nr:unnamed protein product [Closterium sp. NIES-64]
MAREGAASRRASNALKVAFQPFDVDFHPTAHLLSVSFISGVVQLKWKKRGHTDSCRAARFAANGRCECWLLQVCECWLLGVCVVLLGVCGAAMGVWCCYGCVVLLWVCGAGVGAAEACGVSSSRQVYCGPGYAEVIASILPPALPCCCQSPYTAPPSISCGVSSSRQVYCVVVSAAADKSIVVRDTETGERVSKVMGAHSEGINRLACWDDSCVASGDDSGTVKLWDLRQDGSTAGSIATVQGASAYLTSIASGPSCPLAEAQWAAQRPCTWHRTISLTFGPSLPAMCCALVSYAPVQLWDLRQDGGALGSTAAVHLWDLRQDGVAMGSTAIVQVASDYCPVTSHPYCPLWDLRQDGSAVGSTATLWDMRQDGGAVGSTATVQVASDYLTDIRPLPACNRLLAASGDGSMAVVDLATNRLTAHTDSTDDDLLSIVAVKLTAHTDSTDDDLLSIVAVKSDSKVVCGSQSGLLYFFNMNGAERDNDRFRGHGGSVDAIVPLNSAVPHCSQPASRPCTLLPLPASHAPMPSFSLILRPHMLAQLDDKVLLAACLSSMRSTPTSCLTCSAPMPSLSLGLGPTCSPSWTTRRCLQPAPMGSFKLSRAPLLFCHMPSPYALIPHHLVDDTLLTACSDGLIRVLDDDTLLTACSDGLIRVVSVFPNRFLDIVGSHTDAAVEALALSHNHNLLVSAGHDQKLKAWDIAGILDEEEGEDGEEEEEEEEEDEKQDEKTGAGGGDHTVANGKDPNEPASAGAGADESGVGNGGAKQAADGEGRGKEQKVAWRRGDFPALRREQHRRHREGKVQANIAPPCTGHGGRGEAPACQQWLFTCILSSIAPSFPISQTPISPIFPLASRPFLTARTCTGDVHWSEISMVDAERRLLANAVGVHSSHPPSPPHSPSRHLSISPIPPFSHPGACTGAKSARWTRRLLLANPLLDPGNARFILDVHWGEISMVDAERRLLATALLDPGNARFILVSESCAPLFNFTFVYEYLMASPEAYVRLKNEPGTNGRGRWRREFLPLARLEDWRKGGQWFAMDREAARVIVADDIFYPLFKRFCRPPCYADEHYMPTMLKVLMPGNVANRTVTWTDWSKPGAAHPAQFGAGQVTDKLIERMRGPLSCIVADESVPCFLFARKLMPGALTDLLRLAEFIGM